MDRVVTLWRGEMSLAQTGLLYGALGLVLLIAPLMYLAGAGGTADMKPVVIGLSAAVLVYATFIAVAIWRSASRHRGSLMWRLLAKGSVVIVGLQVLVGLQMG